MCTNNNTISQGCIEHRVRQECIFETFSVREIHEQRSLSGSVHPQHTVRDENEHSMLIVQSYNTTCQGCTSRNRYVGDVQRKHNFVSLVISSPKIGNRKFASTCGCSSCLAIHNNIIA